MIKPIASMSSVTVTKNENNRGLAMISCAVEHERNVVAAVVSTAAMRIAAGERLTTNLLRMVRLSCLSPETEGARG